MNKDCHAGRVDLVSGGRGGIGRASALRFANEGGERVIIVGHSEDRFERLAAELAEGSTILGTIRAEHAYTVPSQ